MTPIKHIMIASSAVLAMTGAAVTTAHAQAYRYYDRGYDAGDRLSTGYVDRLSGRIQDAARDGRIDWREARDLQGQLNAVRPLAWRYETGEARPWEVNRLERTVDRVRDEIRD